MEKILASPAFQQAERPAGFLRYIVERALEGDPSGLKETAIGVGLYQKDPSYDPKLDSLVRTQARRVRERLEAYYREEGAADPVRIVVPKGSYVPIFRRREAEAESSVDAIATAAPRRLPIWMWATGSVLGAGAILAGFLLSRPEPAISREQVAPAAQAPRILVLPFRSPQQSVENSLYGQALADSIVASLAGIEQLSVVVAREAEAPGASTDESGLAQARRAGAQFVVSGLFERNSEPASVLVKLTQVNSGEVLWGHSYRFPWNRLVKTEQEMSDAVAEQLSRNLGEKHATLVSRIPPSSMEAYREYLAGHYAGQDAKKNLSLESYATAVGHLSRALELEPDYPEAHATLSGLYQYRCLPWHAESEKLLGLAHEHARKALTRAPRNSEALATLARRAILRRDHPAALGFAHKAVAAEPGNADALSALAEVYTAAGFLESALQAYQRASRKSFVAMEPYAIGAVLAGCMGKIDLAEQFAAGLSAVDPESAPLFMIRGLLKGWRGDRDGASAMHRQIRETIMSRNSPEPVKRVLYSFTDVNLAYALTKQGRIPEAREILDRLPGLMPRRIPIEIYARIGVGQRAEALRLLDESYFYRNYAFLVTDPELKPLYESVEFQRLLTNAYPTWTGLVKEHGAGALVPPPVLPPPEELLRSQGIRVR
ncbi:MAG: hypothetical protein MUC42_08775 [Bryobacter sp.]|nr:hypothetical protein [Bryobacter sp.]